MIKSYGSQNLKDIKPSILSKIKNEKIVTNGKYCKLFEKKISKLLKSKYAVVCNNGTSAIMMAILALKYENLVAIIPNINFVASANIVSLLKGKIVLCDINKETGMVDLNSFKRILKKCKKRKIKPNVFIPVHYAGDFVDLKEISKICYQNKIDIIEDGCHSFGSYKVLNNKKIIVGSCNFSKVTTFSFHAVKNITTLEGGVITTNDKRIYEKLILLRSHSLELTKINDPYIMKYPTLNFRMPEICALIGLEQLKNLNKFKRHRQKIIERYLLKLDDIKSYLKPLNLKNNAIFWHLFVIILKNYKKKYNLMNFLKSNNIGSQIHYKPIYMHPVFKKNIIINDCKNSNFFYKHQLTLPLHTLMTLKETDKIINKIKKFFLR